MKKKSFITAPKVGQPYMSDSSTYESGQGKEELGSML
jgi:hypothetical protein